MTKHSQSLDPQLEPQVSRWKDERRAVGARHLLPCHPSEAQTLPSIHTLRSRLRLESQPLGKRESRWGLMRVGVGAFVPVSLSVVVGD